MSKKPTLAVAMIVAATKDEAPHLERCLKNYYNAVDGIFIYANYKRGSKPYPKIKKIAETYGAEIKFGYWNENFAEARTESFDMVPKTYDWIMWIDADDTISNPSKPKDVITLATPSTDGIMVKYNYDTDEFGNVTTPHTVLRMVRNNGAFKWVGDVHETLIETRTVNRVYTADFTIDHHAEGERRDSSNVRNIRIMERMLENDGDYPDPRTLFYLGTAYYDAGRFDESIDLLEAYLKLSGWDEERSQACVWLGRIFRDHKNDSSKAVFYFLQALYENPKEPTAHVEMGALEMFASHWGKAIMWLEQAVVIKVPEMTTLITSPLENTYRAYMMLAECHLNIGGKDLPLALKLAEAAVKIRPDNTTKDYLEMLKSIVKERNTTQSFVNAVTQLPKEKALRAYEKLDEEYKKNPAVISVMRRFTEPVVWPKKSIAIFCGNSVLKGWGPWSLAEGIGGSEEAVIRISKHLNDLGWKVTVYSEPGLKDGEYDGVVWKNYWEMDLRDTYDVFIAWRSPFMFDKKINARKKYLWMHDVMDDGEFTPDRLKNLDKVMLLSKYHRTVFPSIPDDKIFFTGNGIDPDEFEAWDNQLVRDPHLAIYQSSHVRGLTNLVEIWPDVLKEVPDAKLYTAYGWESYDKVNQDNPERMAWKDNLIKKMKEVGIVDLGKVSQEEVVKMTQQAGVWAYPTQFCEIYCHPAGTKVMTEYGEKNIEELLLTDRVLTHRGVLKPIYQTMRRKADRLIKLNVRSGDDLLLTPNHPVYTKRNGEYLWVNAEDMTTDDPLLTPAEFLNTDYCWTDCAKFVINDGLGYKQNNLPTETHQMPDELEITPEFAKFLGYFAGDGNANERGKVSVLVADSHPEHIKTVVDGFKYIGLEPDISQKRGCKEYRVYNYQLARAFRKFFYDGKTKQLPLWLASYPEALDGLLDADGHCGNGYNHAFTNTSDRLVGWVKIALAIRGYSGKAALRVHKNGKTSRTISWTQSHKLPQYKKINGFIEKKIKSIETLEHNDWVYNIEVTDDHSYVSNGSVVHNCITAIKAQAGGAWPVCTDFAALAEVVKYGDVQHMEAKDDKTPVGVWKEGGLEKYKRDLIYRLKNPIDDETRRAMMKEVRDQFSWAGTARGWDAEFNS